MYIAVNNRLIREPRVHIYRGEILRLMEIEPNKISLLLSLNESNKDKDWPAMTRPRLDQHMQGTRTSKTVTMLQTGLADRRQQRLYLKNIYNYWFGTFSLGQKLWFCNSNETTLFPGRTLTCCQFLYFGNKVEENHLKYIRLHWHDSQNHQRFVGVWSFIYDIAILAMVTNLEPWPIFLWRILAPELTES